MAHSGAASAPAPPRWVVDTDAGVDDAQALAVLLRAHERGAIELVGIMCVCGNVPLELVIGNVCAVLSSFSRKDVPVFVGAAQPLLGVAAHAMEYHGTDGLGNTGVGAAAPRACVVRGEDAADALLRLASASPVSPVSLLTLGPLTNLATALSRPGGRALPSLLAHVVIMGGAVCARGNATLVAEFNVHADVEAAASVFATHWAGGITLSSWELTQASGLDDSFMSAWLGGHTPRSAFLGRISQHLRDLSKAASSAGSGARSEGLFLIPDPLAAVIALSPACISRSAVFGVVIESTGTFSRGMTIVDYARTHSDIAPPCVRVVEAVDMDVVRAVLLESVAGPGDVVATGQRL